MNKSVENLFYDEFFRKVKGYENWSDEEIAGSINKDDIEDFSKWIKEEMISKYCL